MDEKYGCVGIRLFEKEKWYYQQSVTLSTSLSSDIFIRQDERASALEVYGDFSEVMAEIVRMNGPPPE
jgi:hypothetical protein